MKATKRTLARVIEKSSPKRGFLHGLATVTMAVIACLCLAVDPLIGQETKSPGSSFRAVTPIADGIQGVHPGNETQPLRRADRELPGLGMRLGLGDDRWHVGRPHPFAAFPPGTAANAPRVEFPGREVMLRQSTAGLIGGVVGALVVLLPLAAADRGDTDVSDEGMTVGALLGYLGGSTVGVQYYSNRQGMYGSWWGTLGGSAIGMLGGPLFVVTVPIGAMAGFNLTREE